jgi:hypothetical protein
VNDGTTIPGLNYYTGSAFVNLTPSGTTAVAGLVELATDAETQTGTDTVRAVTPSGLQSKISDSTSTTSSTTIASATAVKAAYDLADAALPKTGGRVTGNLEIGPAGSLSFEGSSDDSFETTLAVVNPTADRTITFPNVTGTVVTTGDSGTVTSTMILDGTIVNADINASAAIALSKLGTGALPSGITVNSDNIVDGTIVNADVNASAAIAGTKISPDFGSQTIATTGVFSHALGAVGTPSITFTGDLNTGIYSPGADQVAISTNAVERVEFGTSEVVFNDGGENYDFRIEGDTNTSLFFVDASTDRVGLGTSSPSYLLDIRQDSASAYTANTAPPNLHLQVHNFDTTTAYTPAFIQFAARGSTTTTSQWYAGNAGLDAAYAESAFVIGNRTGASSYAERLRITGAGNVGIGTTSPGALLELGTATPILRFSDTDTVGHHQIQSSNSNFIINSDPTNADANSAISFNVDGSERARIDSSGRLLAGTSSTTSINIFVAQGATSGAGGQFAIARNNNTPGATDAVSSLNFATSTHETVAQIQTRRDSGTWTAGSSYPTALTFSTTADGASSPTERMRITNDGRILLGTTDTEPVTSNTQGISLRGDVGSIQVSRNGLCGLFNRFTTNGEVLRFTRNAVDVGSIDVTTTATSYNTSSDYRLKENVVDLDGAIDRLKQLPVHRFNFIADPGTTVDGFLAHEAQEVVPECATGTKDEVDDKGNPVYQGIDQSKLVPLLTAALQEAIAEIASLKDRVAALEAS